MVFLFLLLPFAHAQTHRVALSKFIKAKSFADMKMNRLGLSNKRFIETIPLEEITKDEVDMQASAVVLPPRIFHPQFRIGYASQLTEKFDNSGSLYSISRLNQAMNASNISKYVPELDELVKYIETTFPHSTYAQDLTIGNLEFDANAFATYYVPALAYGVNERWTIGFGFPIVNLKAQVKASRTGTNNAAYIKNAIAGSSCEQQSQLEASGMIQLCEGFKRLESADVLKEYEVALLSRGYIIPREMDQTVIGDLQIVSQYLYHSKPPWVLYQQATLNLPTGPEDDPDNFIDLPIFHQTWLKLGFHQDFHLNSKWKFGSYLSYTWKMQDKTLKRVPETVEDLLPSADRKEVVDRDLGDIISFGLNVNHSFTEFLNFEVGCEFSTRDQDRYSGDRGFNYHLMSHNTDGEWYKLNAGGTLSTISWFQKGKFGIPSSISYMFSNVFAGRNTDNQQTHELQFKMFF